jgi:hypothetical protein
MPVPKKMADNKAYQVAKKKAEDDQPSMVAIGLGRAAALHRRSPTLH